MSKPLLALICAMDNNRLIGNDNKLPWHLPGDLALFKQTTMAKPIIMGRKTFDSIGRALPGRQNIVITSNPDWEAEGCEVASSIDQALDLVKNEAIVMLIGGASLYRQTIDKADILYLTIIDGEFAGDTWFPEFNLHEWVVETSDFYPADVKNSNSFSFVKYVREKIE